MSKTTIIFIFAFLFTVVGCSVAPRKPMYNPQIGWTKKQVLEDSVYRNSQLSEMRSSTSQGTVETLVFGDPPYAFVYLDERGKVTRFTCLRYCQ